MSKTLHLPYLAVAAIAGAIFGIGLYISGMVNPLKVLRFLDFTAIPSGGWDPSLAFVMIPAVVVMFIAVRIGKAECAAGSLDQFEAESLAMFQQIEQKRLGAGDRREPHFSHCGLILHFVRPVSSGD